MPDTLCKLISLVFTTVMYGRYYCYTLLQTELWASSPHSYVEALIHNVTLWR